MILLLHPKSALLRDRGFTEIQSYNNSSSRHVKNLSATGLDELRNIVKQGLGYSGQPNIRTGKPLNRHRLHQYFQRQMSFRQNR
jgi:hypothetical protein